MAHTQPRPLQPPIKEERLLPAGCVRYMQMKGARAPKSPSTGSLLRLAYSCLGSTQLPRSTHNSRKRMMLNTTITLAPISRGADKRSLVQSSLPQPLCTRSGYAQTWNRTDLLKRLCMVRYLWAAESVLPPCERLPPFLATLLTCLCYDAGARFGRRNFPFKSSSPSAALPHESFGSNWTFGSEFSVEPKLPP
jgi:hypothetical protein